MILDTHVHVNSIDDTKMVLLENMKKSGVDGGIILSAMPKSMGMEDAGWGKRLNHILQFCKDEKYLFPFFFIDPTEQDAPKQVEEAVKLGISGFKIICTHFYPSDKACVDICTQIVKSGKPVLFHSGILWNGVADSSKYNKPVEFEALLSIDGLKLAMAHISWPWCDEMTAVYGKCNEAQKSRNYKGARLYIDNTPGTPEIYRKDALTKLMFSGYDVSKNLIFGTDNSVEDYNTEWARNWISMDTEIYKSLGVSKENTENIFHKNLLSFLGE